MSCQDPTPDQAPEHRPRKTKAAITDATAAPRAGELRPSRCRGCPHR
jgi:hypothetical protein